MSENEIQKKNSTSTKTQAKQNHHVRYGKQAQKHNQANLNKMSQMMYGFMSAVFGGGSESKEQTESKYKSATELVKHVLSSHPIVLFSKTYCPYSKRAKQALSAAKPKIYYQVFELDAAKPLGQTQFTEGEIKYALSQLSGIGTVPQLFANGQFIGDSTAIQRKYAA